MLIKKAKCKTKMIKSKVMISDEVHGCDNCKTEIKDYPNELD